MKTQLQCEQIAKAVLQEYVNACKCDSVQEVMRAIEKMIAVSVFALDAVENGKREIVQ